MKRKSLGLGLALLIGISVAVTDIGTMKVMATQTSDTTGSTTSTTAAPAPQPAYSTANNARFSVDGAELVVTENLNPSKYPADFTETKVECKGNSYKGLKFDNADIQMICLLNQSTGAAAYHIYNASDESVYPFIRIESGNDYIIAMPPSMMDDAQVPQGYTQTELEFEKGDAVVYQNTEGAYIIYAMNKNGDKNWYDYDSPSNTFQIHVTETVPEETVQQTETVQADTTVSAAEQYQQLEAELSKVKTKYRLIMAVMFLIIVILVIVLINTLLKFRNYEAYEEDNEDFLDEKDFYDEYEEEPVEKVTKESVKNIKKKIEKEPIQETEEPKEEITSRKPIIKETLVRNEKKYESDIEVLDLNDL